MQYQTLGGDVARGSGNARGRRAILVIGVSHHERLGLLERITGRDPVSFGTPEWLMPDQVDETYFRLLPSGVSEITVWDNAN